MSEYQYYEFLAIDRALSGTEREELRELSTRAQISATRFTNEYHWGDFRGDPQALMENYYDAHLYFANWGTRRLMFRVPRAALATKTAEQYVYGDTAASLTETGDHLVIDLHADREPADYDWEETHSLGAMTDARTGVLAGDLRLLYLAWLFAIQWDEITDDDTEPPVPAGLGELSGSLRAVVDFLEIDEDLIEAAAVASPGLKDQNPGDMSERISALPPSQKNSLLERVASGEGAAVQAQLLRILRKNETGQAAPAPARTAEELRAAAEVRKALREKGEAERALAELARRETEKAAAYARHLDDLSAREAAAWVRATDLIETKNQRDYDTAVTLLCDLRSLADREGRPASFEERFRDLRRQHQRKPTLMGRFDAAGLPRLADPLAGR